MLPNQADQSNLFTLRLWIKEDEDGRYQWRGKLHHINSNEIRYFQEWSALIPLLLAMLRAANLPQAQGNENKEEASFSHKDNE